MVWTILTFLCVLATKFLTSVRLRGLKTKLEAIQPEIDDLRLKVAVSEEQMEELKQDFAYVLDHVSVFQNRFGKDHLKLDLNPEALEKYRTKLKKP